MKTKELYMVEVLLSDYQLETENVEEVELFTSMDQVEGYAFGAGLMDLDQGCRSLEVFKLVGEEWQYVTIIYASDLEY